MRKMLPILLTWLAFASHAATSATLDIYFIDVEGGQATRTRD